MEQHTLCVKLCHVENVVRYLSKGARHSADRGLDHNLEYMLLKMTFLASFTTSIMNNE